MTPFSQNHRAHLIMREARPSMVATHPSTVTPGQLPGVLSKLNLVLLSVLLLVTLPDIEAMQFGGTSLLFYWVLAFVTFSTPCTYVFGWLLRQAPANVPFYVWILRFMNERWRSFLLFLVWLTGMLGVLTLLGMCVSLVQPLLPIGSPGLPGQSLIFASILIAGCTLLCLPLRKLRYVLAGIALLYLAFFALLLVAAFLYVRAGYAKLNVFPHIIPGHLPTTFSWPLFGLAVLSMLGINFTFFLDGEMRGSGRFLRHSTRFLWGSGLLVALVLVGSTLSLQIIGPPGLVLEHGSLISAIGLALGPGAGLLAQYLLVICTFGIAMGYLLLLSRGLVLCSRLRYVPHSLARLTRFGVPFRAILVQCTLIVGGAVWLFILAPSLLKTFAPTILFATLTTEDQFCLVSSVGNILWATFTALTFVFAFWIYMKKYRQINMSRHERLWVPVLCISGFLSSLVCALVPLTPEWPTLFLSHNHWFPQVLLGLGCSFLLAWLLSEFPRRSALLYEQRLLLQREKVLREELQHTYIRLSDAYNELNYLYREQEQAAVTDSVTGLPNHLSCMQHLDKEIARCQRELSSCLVFFIDLDHFKAINDTWGHQAGDSILRQVAQRLQHVLRSDSFVGRYGGEEFALLLAHTTLSQAQAEATRLLQAIRANPCEWHTGEGDTVMIPVTASIGVAAYGIHGTRREELIEHADQAMYEAKVEGRDCMRVADCKTLQVRADMTLLSPSPQARSAVYREISRDQGQAMLVSPQAVQARVNVPTDTHSYRLLQLAEKTGQFLGVSPEELFLMRLGGLLHDLGKIGIPEAILNKPGPLNEKEWEIMHQHPVIGARLLQEIGGGFHLLAPVVLAHHERWDGTGYPQGLQERKIPLSARVLSVVDAYDAMLSRRPYKDPIPAARARAELHRCAGTQFDPTIVRAFLTLLDRTY